MGGYKRDRDGESRRPESSPEHVAYGMNSVMEMLTTRPAHVHELTLLKGKGGPRIQRLIELARAHGIAVRFADEFAFRKVKALNHQGVLATLADIPTIHMEELFASLRSSPSSPPFILALDCIQDPHNLGAIARSAAAAGVTALILPKDRSAPLSGAALKVSAGGLAHLDVCLVTNLVEALGKLQEAGVWVYGAAPRSDRSLFKEDLTGPVCLVIGGEATGIRPLVKKQCDFLVSIPMPGEMESLNAGAAASIILFEVVRQRHFKEDTPRKIRC